jgi:hypothetical protein
MTVHAALGVSWRVGLAVGRGDYEGFIMPYARFPVMVPEEHLRTIRRWINEIPGLIQRWPALEQMAHSGRIEDARAARLLRRQLLRRTAFPPAEKDAATAFYLWIASWYPAEVHYQTAEMDLDEFLAQTEPEPAVRGRGPTDASLPLASDEDVAALLLSTPDSPGAHPAPDPTPEGAETSNISLPPSDQAPSSEQSESGTVGRSNTSVAAAALLKKYLRRTEPPLTQ